MRPALLTALLCWVSCMPLLAGAAERDRDSFAQGDWQVVCDNTRTCRAAGYQKDDDSKPVSMLILRNAGPGTQPEIELQIDAERDVAGPWTLKLGALQIGGPNAAAMKLDAGQAQRLLPALLQGEQAEVTAMGGETWRLSLAGITAVLLRMDDLQGRIGTPGALVRRGTRAEASVPAAVPAPVVRVKALVPTRQADAALGTKLFPLLDKKPLDSCNESQDVNADSVLVTRLTARRVLLSVQCAMGAYNGSTVHWIANDRAPYSPSAIEPDGDVDAPSSSIMSYWKGRGIGDCIATQTWHFDGKDFVETERMDGGLCRGFAGGAWSLPRYVARVVR